MEAFTSLVRRFERPVYNLCLRHLPGPDAEETAQEAFVRAFVNIQRFDTSRPLLPWLFTIARRLCIDRLREVRKRAETVDLEDRPRDPGPDAEQRAISRQQLDLLEKGLASMDEGPREALALFHFEGLSYLEIASILGVPQGTVMTWLHRGRARLRELLGREEQPPTARPSAGERRAQ